MGNLLDNLRNTMMGFFQPQQKVISPMGAQSGDLMNDPGLSAYYNTNSSQDTSTQPSSFQPKTLQYPSWMANASKTPSITPTPTPSNNGFPQAYAASTSVPSNAFSDFTTAKVPQNQQQLIYSAAQNAHINANVLASLLFSEHGFQQDNKRNYNSDGSYDRGEAQINNVAHPEVTDAQALDPNFAVPYAANLLGQHIKNLGYTKGIAAYNVGEGGATMNGANGPLGPRGTTYLHKVLQGLTPSLIQQLGIQPQ